MKEKETYRGTCMIIVGRPVSNREKAGQFELNKKDRML